MALTSHLQKFMLIDTILESEDFRAGPYVSVWVGDFTDEEALDEYLHRGFTQDFRFTLDEREPLEICAEPQPMAVAAMVADFSSSKHFAPLVASAAAERGIQQVASMVVFYFLAYDPEGVAVAPSPGMTFLGVFPSSE